MYNVSHEKQSLIMAQSSTRLAVEIAINEGKAIDFKFIGQTAHELFKIETALAGFHIEKIKEISRDSRSKTIEAQIKKVKTKDDVHKLNASLSADEQIEYNARIKELLKKVP
jgi:hypothetical protein